jgi:hypothetical protein
VDVRRPWCFNLSVSSPLGFQGPSPSKGVRVQAGSSENPIFVSDGAALAAAALSNPRKRKRGLREVVLEID